MSLRRTYTRVPMTDEPIDGWFIVGTLLVLLGVIGLATGVLAPIVCGGAALASVAALQLSGRHQDGDGGSGPVATEPGAARAAG